MAKEDTHGVYFFNREFARGVDLRLAKDALVVMVKDDWDLTKSEVDQMVGRGSRNQGICEGWVYVYGPKYYTADLAKILKAKEESQTNDGAAILRKFYETHHLVKGLDRRRNLVSRLDNNKWKTEFEVLKQNDIDLYNFISGKYRPRSL